MVEDSRNMWNLRFYVISHHRGLLQHACGRLTWPRATLYSTGAPSSDLWNLYFLLFQPTMSFARHMRTVTFLLGPFKRVLRQCASCSLWWPVEHMSGLELWQLVSTGTGRTVGWLEVVFGGVELTSELRAPTLEVSTGPSFATRVRLVTGLHPITYPHGW